MRKLLSVFVMIILLAGMGACQASRKPAYKKRKKPQRDCPDCPAFSNINHPKSVYNGWSQGS